MERLTMPRDLVRAAERDGRAGWLATLPGTVPTSPPAGSWRWASRSSRAATVPGSLRCGTGPVPTSCSRSAWPHPEAEHEADGLRAWAGDGAIRLSRAEQLADANVLLLERCRPGTALRLRPEPEQDVVIAGLLHRLWRVVPAPGHPFRALQAMCDMWADEFEAADTRPWTRA